MIEATPLEQQVERNFPWNFSVNVVDITFITLGLSLVSRETVMPLLVSQMTDSKIAIGLIPAVYSLGYYLPQLLTANYAERLKWKKPFVVWVSGPGERLPYLLMGLVVWSLAVPAPTVALSLFFLLLAASAVSNGVATPAWFTLIGKVLPVQRRGIFFGLSGGLGALMGIVGAYFVGQILDNQSYPKNFAILFTLSFFFMVISWVGLILNREPEDRVVKPQLSLRNYFRRLPDILRHQQNYRRYLISYSISRVGAMAVGFFLVYGNSRFSLSGAEVGLLTGLLIGSQAVMNLVMGWLADRRGHKVVLAASTFALALAALMAWLPLSKLALMAIFILLGVALTGDQVSRLSIILEFASPEDQPTYIGLTNTLLAPIMTLTPLLGGWLATWLGYPSMFFIAMVAAALGGVLLLFWVREPRKSEGLTLDSSGSDQ
jgi:MFS family permease